MFTEDTVLILGAGASVQYEFPLAINLHEEIIQGYQSLIMKGLGLSKPLRTIQLSSDLYVEDPFMAILSYLELYPLDGIKKRESNEPFFRFYEDLKNGTHDTIDQFLASHPQHHTIGKVFLSHLIISKMYYKGNFADYELQKFQDRDYNGRRSWYHSLIQELQKNAKRIPGLESNKLSIITFNYDLSLEQALTNRLGGEGDYKGADYKKFIDIYHINGIPKELPERITDMGQHVIKSSVNLQIPNEDPSEEINILREQARKKVENAKQIYILGFQFDQSNIETIGLDNLKNKDHIFPLNFDGNLGTQNRILNLEIPSENIFKGSMNNPKFIDQAIKEGFFEIKKQYRNPRISFV